MTKTEAKGAVGEDTEELEQELAAHKDFAQTGYKAFHYDQLLSQKSWEITRTDVASKIRTW